MAFEHYLKKMADDSGPEIAKAVALLRGDVEKLKVQYEQKLLEYQSSSHRYERLLNFRPTLGGHFQCVPCWINLGINADLRRGGSTVSTIDNFECSNCQEEYSFTV